MIYIWNSYELMGYLFYYALGIAMENGHLWFISPLNMVMFHGYIIMLVCERILTFGWKIVNTAHHSCLNVVGKACNIGKTIVNHQYVGFIVQYPFMVKLGMVYPCASVSKFTSYADHVDVWVKHRHSQLLWRNQWTSEVQNQHTSIYHSNFPMCRGPWK